MMRRLILLLLVLLLMFGCGGESELPLPKKDETYSPFRDGTFYVISADAPNWAKRVPTAENVWICSGTQAAGGDEVQFAAAAKAAGEVQGIVRLVGPTFYVTKPTVYPDYGPSITEISTNDASVMADPYVDNVAASTNGDYSILHGVTSWDEGSFADWAFGDMLQLQRGSDVTPTEAAADYCKVYNVSDDYDNLAAAVAGAGYTANFTMFPDAEPEAVNDAIYFGHDVVFESMSIDMSAVVAVYAADSVIWEYYDGVDWETLTVVDATDTDDQDGDRPFQADGIISWQAPTDWASVTIDTQVAYWVRARCIATVDITTIPVTNAVEHGVHETIEDNKEDCIDTVAGKSISIELTNAGWTDAGNILTEVGAFADYTFTAGDTIFLNAGIANLGWYTIASRTSDDAIVLSYDCNVGNVANGITSEPALLLFERFVNHSASAATDYTGVDVDKIIPALVVPTGVTVIGDGIRGTQILLADDSNCTLMMIWNDDTTVRVYTSLRDLWLYGKYTEQGDGDETKYDSRCHGLVINDESWDVDITRVSIYQTKGNGLVVTQPWGLQWRGGFIERYTGKGIHIGDGNNGSFWGVKVKQGGYDTEVNCYGLFLREGVRYLSWNGGILASNSDWAVYLKDARINKFIGAYIESIETTSAGGIYIDPDSSDNVITGCTLRVEDTNVTAIGIDLSQSDNNAITGCVFHEDCPTAIEIATSADDSTIPRGNSVVGCVGVDRKEACEFVRLDNDTGGGIVGNQFVEHDGTLSSMKQLTTNGIAVGVSVNAVGDGESGMVQIRGLCLWAKIDNDNDLDIGSELTASDTDVGCLGIAGAGDNVWAILEYDNNGNGTATTRAVTLITPYVKP